MAIRLSMQENTGFETQFRALLSSKREVSEDVDQVVRDILEDVRERGDKAVIEYTGKFDRLKADTVAELRVTENELVEAVSAVDQETLDALAFARDRIHAHHARQMPKDDHYTDSMGVELGSRWTAIEAVGLYVPGGLASYPSSVLMNAVPARVAGVERIAMAVPSPGGILNPQVLAAAHIAGITEIYKIGGAQAIAALAYGTQSIAPVYKIVGPGNAFVAAAKRRVFGIVGIDMIAGPSEVVVLADAENDPDWIAADLLAQAEHDSAAQSILITDSKTLAFAVEKAVDKQLETLPKAEIAGASWRDFGAVIIVPTLDEAVPLINRIAAEHLELAVADPDAIARQIRNAGAIFLGRYTPEAIGDYVGGSNHVLPTARSARFSSGLSVLDFVKRTSVLKCDADSLRALGPSAIALGQAEDLAGHARSVAIRLNL